MIFCVAVTAASILFLSSWSVYHSLEGNKINSYGRFFVTDSLEESHFNFYGLLSPIQFESQKIIYDTINFTHTVVYPLAPSFKLVNPVKGEDGEKIVAEKMTKVVSDTIDVIKKRAILDYDKTSLLVRKKINPDNIKLSEPKISLSLIGTASPESGKDGFIQSIMPGHIEKENLKLAEDRLNRTASILEKNGFKVEVKKFNEIQFPNKKVALEAVTNRAILDKMRYVKADVVIPVERLEITTITAPIVLPIWLLLFVFGLSFLRKLRVVKFRHVQINFGYWSWTEFWELLKLIASYLIVIGLIIGLLIIFNKWIILLLSIISLVFILYLLWKYSRGIWDFISFIFLILQLGFSYLWLNIIILFKWMRKILLKFFSFLCRIIMMFTKWVLRIIRRFIDWVLLVGVLISDLWAWIQMWWHFKTRCQKILFFVLPYAVIITALAIYLWVTRCP